MSLINDEVKLHSKKYISINSELKHQEREHQELKHT